MSISIKLNFQKGLTCFLAKDAHLCKNHRLLGCWFVEGSPAEVQRGPASVPSLAFMSFMFVTMDDIRGRFVPDFFFLRAWSS